MAETIAGDGSKSSTVSNIPGSITPTTNLFRGMAPQASLFVQPVDLSSGPYISDSYLQSNASFVLTANALAKTGLLTNGFVNNLSWGYQSTVYDLAAASYDLATRNAQPNVPGEHSMLFVVAAGNGYQAVGSILSPATAKNVISVTAIDSPRFISGQSMTFDSNAVATFASAGNVGVGTESAGGRFKPDVVAPGVFTISARAASYVDPTNQVVLEAYSQQTLTLTPGESQLYQVTVLTGTTNLMIQVLPNQFSPVPFPTNLQIYFDAADPPVTLVTATNEAGVPIVANPAIGYDYLMITSPDTQPWPVNFDLRIYGLQTNNTYSNYYQMLATNLNASLKPSYRYESGTSIAAGAVSGMLALMQDYLFNTWKVTPSPALLKALLINGSRPFEPGLEFEPDAGGEFAKGMVCPVCPTAFR